MYMHTYINVHKPNSAYVCTVYMSYFAHLAAFSNSFTHPSFYVLYIHTLNIILLISTHTHIKYAM